MKVPLVQTLIYMFNTIFQIVYSCKSIIPILIHTRISFTTVTAVLDHVLVWVTHVRTNDPQKKWTSNYFHTIILCKLRKLFPNIPKLSFSDILGYQNENYPQIMFIAQWMWTFIPNWLNGANIFRSCRSWCHYLHTDVLNAFTKCDAMIDFHIIVFKFELETNLCSCKLVNVKANSKE